MSKTTAQEKNRIIEDLTSSSLKGIQRKSRPGLTAPFLFVLLVLFLYVSPSIAHAAEAEEQDLKAKAKACLDKGEFDRALEAYQELFRQDPGDPDINFNLGRAAFETGDFETAIMAFDRVLIARPDAVRAKLEIARSYYQLGSLDSAEQSFLEVLSVDPPKNVRSNIDMYLKAIRSSKKEHFLSGKISLGMDFDDNVNATPTSRDIEINSFLGVVSVRMDRPEKDQIQTSTASLNYIYRPTDSNVSWKLSVMNYNSFYQDAEDLDISLFDMKAGAGITGSRTFWDIYVLTNQLNFDYGQYLRTYGMGSTMGFSASQALLFNLDSKYKTKVYFDSNDRDAANYSLTFAPVFVSGSSRISLSLGGEYEAAREDVYSYKRLNSIVSYELKLPYETVAFASYWYQGTGYKDIYPLFGKKRNDDVQYISAGCTKSLTSWKSGSKDLSLDLNINYTYTRSDSNIDLYAYTKNVISTSLSVAF